MKRPSIKNLKKRLWERVAQSVTSFPSLFLFSLICHTFSYQVLDQYDPPPKMGPKKEKIEIKILSKAPHEELFRKKIIEAKQKETEAPKDAKYLGQVDHIAKKEKKIKKKLLTHAKALDPGESKKKQKGPTVLAQKKPTPKKKQPKEQKPLDPEKIIKNRIGKEEKPLKEKPLSYQDLLKDSMHLIQARGGKDAFHDYVEDEMEEGDTIDLSTTRFRYIGYFTNLRKQIEMTWVYPAFAARSGKQGNVYLSFTVNKEGQVLKVKVLRSSGYRELDTSIVQAINEASPFAPLPENFGKEKLTITGTFSYIISGFSSQ